MDVWIGTSGYSYPDWVGDFYPAGTKPNQMLGVYSRRFPLVELNFTFYRLPTRDMLLRMADRVPPGFQFVVKLPQTLSHEHNAADLGKFRTAALGLKKRHQLMGLLCQMPQSRHYDNKTLDWLKRLAAALGDMRPAVEFRHRSWARPEMPAWLAEHGLDLVAVDVPDLPNLFPRGWAQSGPRAYVRLHSRDAGRWYAGDKERYDYDYDDAELTEWVDAARQAQPEQLLVLFNNCYRGQAGRNARRIGELFAARAPAAHIIESPAGPAVKQRSLFE